jgi:hypothetical protein
VIDFDAHGIRRFVTNRIVVTPTNDPGPTAGERRATALSRAREARAIARADKPAAPPRKRTKKAAAGADSPE